MGRSGSGKGRTANTGGTGVVSAIVSMTGSGCLPRRPAGASRRDPLCPRTGLCPRARFGTFKLRQANRELVSNFPRAFRRFVVHVIVRGGREGVREQTARASASADAAPAAEAVEETALVLSDKEKLREQVRAGASPRDAAGAPLDPTSSVGRL